MHGGLIKMELKKWPKHITFYIFRQRNSKFGTDRMKKLRLWMLS